MSRKIFFLFFYVCSQFWCTSRRRYVVGNSKNSKAAAVGKSRSKKKKKKAQMRFSFSSCQSIKAAGSSYVNFFPPTATLIRPSFTLVAATAPKIPISATHAAFSSHSSLITPNSFKMGDEIVHPTIKGSWFSLLFFPGAIFHPAVMLVGAPPSSLFFFPLRWRGNLS